MSFMPVRPMPNYRRMMVFIDGENIAITFKRMVEEKGYVPRPSVINKKDVYVWNPEYFCCPNLHVIVRCNYYTCVQGNNDDVDTVCKDLKELKFRQHSECHGLPNSLNPKVFKKKKGKKSKGVDIQIAVDIISNTYMDNLDAVYLIGGDGDYAPLIKEVMHCGKHVYLGAFSIGLDSRLEYEVDKFQCLDTLFFQGQYKFSMDVKNRELLENNNLINLKEEFNKEEIEFSASYQIMKNAKSCHWGEGWSITEKGKNSYKYIVLDEGNELKVLEACESIYE